MPILQVRGLVKYYGRRKVVDGVDFEVDSGEGASSLPDSGVHRSEVGNRTVEALDHDLQPKTVGCAPQQAIGANCQPTAVQSSRRFAIGRPRPAALS